MIKIALIILSVLSAVCVLVICLQRRRTEKIVSSIERMINCAADGTFIEREFDESRLSALETKFAHYIAAVEVSAKNVKRERDKISTLISDISHQTKTPLANILLYTELLEEGALPKDAKNNVTALHAQADKLSFLIGSLVKLSRLESGILTLSPGKNKVEPLVERAADAYRKKAEEKNLVLKTHSSGAFAVFDPKWTQEAIENIIDNAVKYTDKGYITVNVEEYEMFICIRVSDSGCGINEEEQAKVFARFYRTAEAADSEGVGIGLCLAREIITGQGGYIKLKSVKGEGSVFSVFLPAQ